MGEPAEWTGRDGRTVEVDYPSPARTVVLTVTVDGLSAITVRAGGADGTELYRGKGAWSVLVPPARQEELRRITVHGVHRWQLRLHDPAEVGSVGSVTGDGPRVLVHPGGTAVVDVTHYSSAEDIQLFRLVRHTAAGGREVLATGERFGRLYRSNDWTLLLEGPQVLVVEQGESWSLTGRPADLPPSTETVRYGIGDRREVFEWPDGTRPALLEVGTAEEPEWGSVRLELTDHGGRGLDHGYVYVSTRDGVQRLLLQTEPARRALGPLRVDVSGARGSWRLELLPIEEARELADRADGVGNDVLAYTGPPAVLRVWTLAERSLYVTIESGGRRIRASRSRPGEWCGAVPIGGPAGPHGPAPIGVDGSGRWRLEVVPLAVVPAFARKLTGLGCEVVRWTGAPGRLTVATGRRNRGGVTATVLDERLKPLGSTGARPGLFRSLGGEPVALRPGDLVAVSCDFGEASWRLTVR
ncbi:hypothetical protein [Kitasatospora purpeofusca]|uniref:hypothetical protein n=1 Tax=Kitasatospora purpeofusca TaxID=67352 RepID=UPI002A5994B9|nr:hypothetical protein [Kitasatospora purpeofusca]MDY0812175.1 hypothetical protein [Kitasatospora purpeofusca]